MTAASSHELPAYIAVPEKHAVALSNLAKLSQDAQGAIYRVASEIPASTQPWDALRNAIAKLLKGNVDDAKALATAIIGLFYVRQRAHDKGDSEFVQAVVKGILSSAQASAPASSDALQAVVVNLLALKNLEVSHRAGRVRFDHAFHMHDASIVTDLRPIFDASGNAVEGAVISHTLKFDYAGTSEDDMDLYLAVDDSDLDKLEAAIKRARRKEVALRSFAKGSNLKIIGDPP